MDKQTLQTYGMILVSVLIVSALLLVFTPLGGEITSGIEGLVDDFMGKAQMDEDPDDIRDTVDRNPPSDMEKIITLTIIYENGQEVRPTKEIPIQYGETIDLTNEIPSISGYKPNFNPGKITVTRDMNFTVIFYPEQFSITYVLDDGTIVSSKPSSYIYGQVTQLPTKVVKEGYVFTGWYTNASCSGSPITEIESGKKEDVTVYAGWSNATYTVTYMSKGVDITDTITGVKTVVYGLSQDLPRLGTTGGLYFAGWYDNEMFSGAPATYTPKHPDDNLVYYAKWTNDGYNVTYVTNGGSFTSAYPSNYTNGSGLTLPTNITRTGCSFVGWFDNASCTGTPVSSISSSETGDKVFYAKWSPSTYTITYITNGGTITDKFTSTYTYYDTKSVPSIAGESVKYPTSVQKSGYVFVGWRDSATGEIVVQTEDGRSGPITLTAVYTTAEYALTFDANGGSFMSENSNIPSQTTYVNYGDVYGSLPTVYRSGCTFLGWFTDPIAGTEVLPSTIYASSGSTTIYAHWAKNSYNIIYEKNGGIFESAPETIFEFGVSYRLPTDIYKAHYTFSGWYTSENFATGTEIQEITSNMSSNIQVYAKWTPVLYTITYDTAGGDISGSFPTTYTYGDTIVLPRPTKWGCAFNGWKDVNTGEIVSSISATTHGNKNFIAQWGTLGTQVTINLVDNYGSVYIVNAQPLTYVLEDVVIGQKYTIAANSIAQQLSVGDDYYHGESSFTITHETGFVDGKYQVNINAYPYRKLTINSMIYGTETSLSIYDNVTFKFKQEQQALAEGDINNPTLYESLDIKNSIIEFDDIQAKRYAFANKVSIDGQMFDCTRALSEINALLKSNYNFSTQEINVIFWYGENVYTLIFNEHLDQTIVPNIQKPVNFPTTYLSTEGYKLPEPTRECYRFDGWIALREDGTAITLINGNTIPSGTTGTIRLTSKWVIKDKEDSCHTYAVTTPATCTTDGLKECTKCLSSVVLKATGHNFDNIVPEVYTGTANGFVDGVYSTYISGAEYHRILCKNCSSVYKLEKHEWENDGKYISYSDAEHKKQCSTCRAAYYAEHNFDATSISVTQHHIKCDDCNHEYDELHHIRPDDQTVWQNNDGHESGCTLCGATWSEQHTWTATSGGYYCSVCDKSKQHIVSQIP